MNLPLNLSESEVLSIIEDIVNSLAPTFKFGYFDIDDLKQEGRIFAMEALPRYNPNRNASLRTFLQTHVRNRYINLKRNKYMRTAPKNMSEDQLEDWFKRNGNKRALLDTLDISEGRNEPVNDSGDSFVDVMQHKEMLRIIDIHLPLEYRGDYRCILEDVKIPKNRRTKVIEILKEIINEHFIREKTGQTE